MKINLTYSVNDKTLIPDFYHKVLDYYGLSAKNIKNSTIFIIRNILSSYDYDKTSDSYIVRNNLHSKQSEMLDFVNQATAIVNTNSAKKFEKKNKNNAENKDNKPKVIKQLKY